jgi:hypothetical protein
MSIDTLPSAARDPLLAAAKFVIVLLVGVLILVMAAVVVAFGAALVLGPTEVLGEIGGADASVQAYWAVLALLLLFESALFLGIRFLLELRRIVLSVEKGDPFHPANAERLGRMGWLALAIWLADIPIGLIGAWLNPYLTTAEAELEISGDFGVESLFLILTLFILARVFRQGAAMRDDLEGTV